MNPGPTPPKAALLAERQKRQAQANRLRWRTDPTAFALEALGVTLWDAQQQVATDVASGRKTSWRASQKVGKSTLFAVLTLWKVYCFDRALVVLSSGNLQQVKAVLWREIRKLHAGARIPLGGTIGLDPGTGLVFEDGRAAYGLTVRDAERAGGYSSPELLVLLDEASGIDDEIIEAFLGNLAGGGTILLAGNPTKTVGFFARTQREKLDGWALHHTSSFDSPNVKAGRVIIPGLATPDFPASMASDFGKESAAYQVRVLGQYATQANDAVIPLALVEEATANWSEIETGHGPLEIGVDPARFGDDESVIMGRVGSHGLPASFHRKLDNLEVAAQALEYAESHRQPGQPVIIRVDVGGLGAGVYDHLTRVCSDRGITVQSVNAGSASRYPTRFANVRAQLWWTIREWLKRGGTLPPDQRRDAELLAAKYTIDHKLRTVIASKDDMRKVLHRSPDRADALALALFSEHSLAEGEGSAHHVPLVQPGRLFKPHEGRQLERLADPDAPRFTWQPGRRLPSRHGW